MASRRAKSEVTSHLKEFPRQLAALESAMGAFGDDFDLRAFKQAFETREDMAAYNRVQALERAVGRVQNFVAQLARSGAQLAGLPGVGKGSDAERAFAALREAGAISASLSRKLLKAQKARTRIEHAYVTVPAGDVHRTAELVYEAAGEFIAAYREWVAPLLRAG